MMNDVLEHSFRNFHVKGFDYLCVKRTLEHTRKVYFFEGDVAQLPEVVNPHDHRYDFRTTVLCGHMSNSQYVETRRRTGKVYQEFEWRTPLNGGDGFTWKRETRLIETQRHFYRRGDQYHMGARDFHTIRMHREGTVMVLDQYADCVAIGEPTRTFMGDKRAPDMSGLYDRFDADSAIRRFEQYKALMA